ncbi:phosphoribosylanthranilate isomerase [Candidatus Latescibacterota bacterium]
MKLNVKICGFTHEEDALLAEDLGASAIGFVFFQKSPRYITPEDAGKISDKLGPFIARVGVFVDEKPDTVKKTVKTARLTAVQLHGTENTEYIDLLEGIPVIKAFRVGNDFEPRDLERYKNVNTFLLDTYVKNHYGGTGITFDWSKANKCNKYGRIIIAGGLNESNATQAVECVHPWGIDVSSGVEKSPGLKDPEKMKALFRSLEIRE